MKLGAGEYFFFPAGIEEREKEKGQSLVVFEKNKGRNTGCLKL